MENKSTAPKAEQIRNGDFSAGGTDWQSYNDVNYDDQRCNLGPNRRVAVTRRQRPANPAGKTGRIPADSTDRNLPRSDLPNAKIHAADKLVVLTASEAAAPLTELMLARPMDGAVAVLIASEDAARRSGGSPVFVTGMGSSTD